MGKDKHNNRWKKIGRYCLDKMLIPLIVSSIDWCINDILLEIAPSATYPSAILGYMLMYIAWY